MGQDKRGVGTTIKIILGLVGALGALNIFPNIFPWVLDNILFVPHVIIRAISIPRDDGLSTILVVAVKNDGPKMAENVRITFTVYNGKIDEAKETVLIMANEETSKQIDEHGRLIVTVPRIVPQDIVGLGIPIYNVTFTEDRANIISVTYGVGKTELEISPKTSMEWLATDDSPTIPFREISLISSIIVVIIAVLMSRNVLREMHKNQLR